MRKTKRLIFSLLTIILFGLNQGFAQDKTGLYNIIESYNDSIDLANHFYDLYDSNSMYHPAADLYENWDNDYVHYPQVDFSRKEDTTVIILAGGSNGRFVMPRKAGINSEYGWRHRRFHYGMDIDLDIGDSVKCAFDGVVRISKYTKGYGNTIVVRHYNGLETVYGHLSVNRVVENQPVKAGDLLGYGGSTGRSTGPHLHFETRYLGTPFNPRKIIDFEKTCLRSDTLLLCKYTFNNLQPAKSSSTVTYASRTTSTTTRSSGTQSYNSGGATYHTIRKGETLSYLATIYHTTVTRICQLNGLSTRSILQIGQKVRVR
jgi:murein DD-endopeptidase MepM/ murein hydrolase activator NlpD